MSANSTTKASWPIIASTVFATIFIAGGINAILEKYCEAGMAVYEEMISNGDSTLEIEKFVSEQRGENQP